MSNPGLFPANSTVSPAVLLPNPCICLISHSWGPILVPTNASPMVFPIAALPVMNLHSGALCNVSPSHLFCLFNRTAPVSLESIPPPCGR